MLRRTGACLGMILVVAWLAGCGGGAWPGAELGDWEAAWEPEVDVPATPDAVPSTLAWEPLATHAAPVRLRTHRVLWLRAKLPRGTWREPVLFLPKVFLTVGVYLDGRRVYHLDDYRAASGIPWHAVPLADQDATEVVIRLYSRYTRIGLAEPARVGERAAFVEAMYRGDAVLLVHAVFFVVVALAAFVLALRSREARALLGLGIYASALVGWSLYHTKTKQLWGPDPGAWFAVWWVAIPLIGAGVSLFFEHVFGPGPRRVVTHVRRVYFALAALAAVSLVSDALLERISPVVFGAPRVLGLASSIPGCVFLWRKARGGDAAARVFACGYAVALVTFAHDISMSFGWWRGQATWAQWGYAAMTLSLLEIVRQRWVEVHRQLRRHLAERDALLHDLHDGLGGIITNVKLVAERARTTDDEQRAARALEVIADRASEGMAELRTLLRGLDDAPVTWRALAGELRRAGANVLEPLGVAHEFTAELADDAQPTDGRVAINCVRVHREALTNIAKHAGARHVRVSLRVDAERTTLAIADDGRGEPATEPGVDGGRGLRSMHRRAAELGGTLVVEHSHGTVVRLELPTQAR